MLRANFGQGIPCSDTRIIVIFLIIQILATGTAGRRAQFSQQFRDFFADEIGNYFYNRGLLDAQTILQDRVDNILEAITELEKPVD